jgi:uncharacterized membrane protein YccC
MADTLAGSVDVQPEQIDGLVAILLGLLVVSAIFLVWRRAPTDRLAGSSTSAPPVRVTAGSLRGVDAGWAVRITGEWSAVTAAVRAGAGSRLAGAGRAALCLAVPLAVGAAAGRVELGAAASFGTLSAVYVPQSPYRYRSRTVAAVGAGLVLAVLLGGLVSLHPWWAVLTSGVVAGAASFVCQAVELPPPRELMLVLALLVATDVPATPAEALTRTAFAAAGAVLALGARLLDTGIGVVLALLLRRLLWPQATTVRLPVLQARVVAAVRAALQSAWTPGDPETLPQQRRALQTELATLRAVHADALADEGDDAAADTRWPVSAAVEELAYLALALPPHRGSPHREEARVFLDHLTALCTAIAECTTPPSARPEVSGYPRTSTAASIVADSAARAAARDVRDRP